MSKDNYDDLADFCGPKDFYDLDGDGHLDAFEAAMMASDVEDEQRASEQHSGSYTPPPPSYSPSKPTQEPQGCGCLSTIITAVVLGTLWWLVEKIFF